MTNILVYRAVNPQGNGTTLITIAGYELSRLPEDLYKAYLHVTPEAHVANLDEVDPQSILTKEVINNLRTRSWDAGSYPAMKY